MEDKKGRNHFGSGPKNLSAKIESDHRLRGLPPEGNDAKTEQADAEQKQARRLGRLHECERCHPEKRYSND
jgi:hypothetical protein